MGKWFNNAGDNIHEMRVPIRTLDLYEFRKETLNRHHRVEFVVRFKCVRNKVIDESRNLMSSLEAASAPPIFFLPQWRIRSA